LGKIMKPKIYLAPSPLLFALIASLLLVPTFHQNSTLTATAQGLSPAGALQELSHDDGSATCAIGTGGNLNGRNFGWANKLTPTSYPATLRSVSIGFNRTLVGQSTVQDALYRIVVYADPEGDGPSNGQQPLATFTGRVRGEFNEVMTFNLISPVTITAGSFVVGAIDDFGFGSLPALVDIPGNSNPRGSESFVSFDGGGNWRTQASIFGTVPNCASNPQFPTAAGSWLIRATVESNPAEVPVVTHIKDPAAVEPWGVAINAIGSEVFVANYVSDNVTVIKTSDNTFQNLAVGDGPGGSADGPYGVVTDPRLGRVYVTLFGSNTIPSKEFPTDYSTVAANGRVAVLDRQFNGIYTQASLITVGKGPKFAALGTGVINSAFAEKLYVPCGGANRVDVINITTNQKVREIAVGSDPSSCTFSPSQGKVYVTNAGDGTISVIDFKTDTKIKDIAIPTTVPPAPGLPPLPALRNPISGTISPLNNNLYVTYNGASDAPHGAIVEINTCSDSFVRFVTDQTISGTAAGSAGASGIPAPTVALTRDAGTGLTANAGGGGGGPFGISSPPTALGGFPSNLVIFTNDALGIVGAIDARIDQVVTAPPILLANCPKPRGVASRGIFTSGILSATLAYVACGQPDNSVLAIRLPALRENIADVPVVTSAIEVGKKISIQGKGFVKGSRLEAIDPDTGLCLTFQNPPKITGDGTGLVQKTPLSDGRSIKSVFRGRSSPVFFRIINPDGSIRIISAPVVASSQALQEK
jgi:YVTN family beta-propeller protein